MEEIIVHGKGREKRWVLKKDQKVAGLYTYQPQEETLTGNIYFAKVVKVQKGLGAAFVDIGYDKNGYLHEKDFPQNVAAYQSGEAALPISKCVHEGQKILVQVTKDAVGTKGPKLSAVIELKGEHLVYMPEGHYVAVSKKLDDDVRRELKRTGREWKDESEGVVFRTKASSAGKEALVEELDGLRKNFQRLESMSRRKKAPSLLFKEDPFLKDLQVQLEKGAGGRVYVDDQESFHQLQDWIVTHHDKKWSIELYQGKENIFRHFEVSSVWKNALKKVVWLDSGAFLLVESTEALTVIDVNSGKFTGKDDLEQTVLKTNVSAAKEIAKQLVLRNISGIILIDFIDMKRESHRQEVVATFQRALQDDSQRTTVLGFTELGVLELTRKRSRPSLNDYLTVPCPVCSGTGRVISPESKAFQLERELWEYQGSDLEEIHIEGTKEVLDVFAGIGHTHVQRLEKALKVKLDLQVSEHPHPFYQIGKMR
ncbi:Rne/Rng family ribonuclease [Rossellomorea aquimaris]|uniref:Rne/Rng family ribonuclease n=1 Tax=Rossellomorea aquimaris TaxID=189382 RepID=UPI001CD7AB97|nr:Rne/Rng family ribonuclease [Rossellomorea aquimaris]MCA1056308.1 Rne/Rng family ribonuclease [Rossellomorea aquimaris]